MPPRASLTSTRIARPPARFLVNSLARNRDRFHCARNQESSIDPRLHDIRATTCRPALSRRHTRLDEHLQLPVAAALFVVIARAVAARCKFHRTGRLAEAEIDAVAQCPPAV